MSAEIVAHMLGDYVLQSDWMANNKTSAHLPAALHGLTYAVPFLAITRSPWRLGIIAGTHFAIDRWRLARYPVWLKNQTGSKAERYPLSHADGTGYHADWEQYWDQDWYPDEGGQVHAAETDCTASVKPAWMRIWLFIMADNSIHLAINNLALRGV